MSEPLGLSIGVANLVAARPGSAPVRRSAVLTLFEHRATEIGLPEENPNLTEPGLVLRGFVERVGDRTPLVAADGTKYLGEALTVEAVEAMAGAAGFGTPITIAIPSYWSEAQVTAMRQEFFAQPDLAPSGLAPVLISDATAALAALRATPGFPTNGVVALCDFGAGGTSVTLIDAGSNFRQIGSVRYADFSGDAIDQLIVDHLRAATTNVETTDGLGSTARMGSLARLADDCRRAKEQLSTATETTIAAGSGAEVRLSRAEFEQIISESLDRFLGAVEEILQRNGIARPGLAAVAIVGGGASIPLLAARLSASLQVPILTAPQPECSSAVGAAVLGQLQSSAGAATTASPIIENPTELVGTAADDMTQAVSAARGERPEDALAWSQDQDDDEPVPYTGPEHSGEYARAAAELDYADDDPYAAEAARLPWYKRTALVLTVGGAGVAVLVALLLALILGHTRSGPGNTPPPITVTITGPNNSTTVTVIPGPPSPSTPAPETETTTTAPPTTTPPPTTTRERLFPRFEPPPRR